MTRKLYWRCNGGDYISSSIRNCPWDGWTSPEVSELCSAADVFAKQGRVPSIAELKGAKVSEQALRRTVVMEFGDDRAVFDAVMPQEYVHHGKTVKPPNVPLELM